MDFFDIDPRFRSPVLEERRLKKLAEKKYNIKLPPNTLTNSDGTPYSAGHDRAIDEQKEKAHHYARAFTQKFYTSLFAGEWSPEQEAWFKDTLREHLEEFALAILKEQSQ